MSMRDILVHLDSSERCVERLHLAISLALRHGARLTGLFAQQSGAHRVGLVVQWPSEDYVHATEESKKLFTELTADLPGARWMDLNRGGEQEVLQRMTDISRHFDLIIMGQHDEATKSVVPVDMLEQVIVETGRPVLVVPYAGRYSDVGQRPLFAWAEARAATRALNDAIPLILPAADAQVISLGAREQHDEFANLVVEHLAAHDIKAQFQHFVLEEIKLMDTILNRCADHSADLLVIGAFGRHTMFGRGAGTRFMMRHMTCPVLFSH